MFDFPKLYFDAVLMERGWSWSVIGIIYLIMTILVRQFVFRSLIQNTRGFDANVYSHVKSLYLRNSTPGWILYFISFLLVIVSWVAWKGQKISTNLVVLFALFLSALFFLSIILHLATFTRALLAVFRQKMGVEKEF